MPDMMETESQNIRFSLNIKRKPKVMAMKKRCLDLTSVYTFIETNLIYVNELHLQICQQ